MCVCVRLYSFPKFMLDFLFHIVHKVSSSCHI